MKWYLKVLKQYAVFSGRARRKECWMFILFTTIFGVIAIVLDNLLGLAMPGEAIPYGVFYSLYSLAILVPSLAVLVRRLHDVGKGGGWICISFVPLIGMIWLLVLMCQNSEPGSNRFGENPKIS
ncbi:MAG: DUF805 domain-containing protein [Bacteroidales bacterium]|jgi:uncharacterized membrane protein YhaH (DUF805 family)|nr:DUF805 domain-containing protein [Bacteroidales bacterium]